MCPPPRRTYLRLSLAPPTPIPKSAKSYPPPLEPPHTHPHRPPHSRGVLTRDRVDGTGGEVVASPRVQPSGRGDAPSGSLSLVSREGRKSGPLPSGSPLVRRSRLTAPKTPPRSSAGRLAQSFQFGGAQRSPSVVRSWTTAGQTPGSRDRRASPLAYAARSRVPNTPRRIRIAPCAARYSTCARSVSAAAKRSAGCSVG